MRILDIGYLEKSMTYPQFLNTIQMLIKQNKTTGSDHSEAMLHYTRMGLIRMNRIDRKVVLNEGLIEAVSLLSSPIIWLVITEAWCGDSAQLLPVLNQLQKAVSNMEVRVVWRDENIQLMDRFLTNQSRSIPKLLLVEESSRAIIFDWGPRPHHAQKMVLSALGKAENPEEKGIIFPEIAAKVQKWYAKDKTVSIQEELRDGIMAIHASEKSNRADN